MKIAGGVKEQGIIVGNAYDKYGSSNPIVKRIMQGFDTSLSELVDMVSPSTIHEVGCGEGYWVMRWAELGFKIMGSDFSTQVIAIAQENARARGLSPTLFETRSIYELDVDHDCAELVVCCEVLEHLDNPRLGLKALQQVTDKYLVVSVPREPVWRALNLVRGKYISDWGNTPGHLQHWSKNGFVRIVSQYFDVVEVKSPLPWTMLLCQSMSHAYNS